MEVQILRGLPGSGKSTWAEAQGKDGVYTVVFSADKFFMKEGKYVFNPAKIGDAHAECFRKFIDGLNMMREVSLTVANVIVDNTNTSAVEIAPYALAAAAFGHTCRIVTFPVDVAVAVKRNVHGVPEATIRAMAERMKEPLPPWWKQVTYEG